VQHCDASVKHGSSSDDEEETLSREFVNNSAFILTDKDRICWIKYNVLDC
jgi:hypothetical protein